MAFCVANNKKMQLLLIAWEYLRRLLSDTYDPRDLLPVLGLLLMIYLSVVLVGLLLEQLFPFFRVA